MGQQPEIAIVIFITRHWAQKDLFYCLERLDIDPHHTQTIFYIDTNDPQINKEHMKDFINSEIIETRRNGPSEMRIAWRRDRIIENHENVKKYIKPEVQYVVGFEDDTLFDRDAVQRMLTLIQRPKVGFVEGVQVGRWSHKYVGAWKVDDLENPTKIESLMPGEGIEEIDAGGWYCFMTKAELFKNIKRRWHDECFGPDVCYGLDVKKQGYKNLIDWGLICGHNDYGKILLPDSETTKVQFNKKGTLWQLSVGA